MNTKKIEALFERYSKDQHFSGTALIKRADDDVFIYSHGYAHRGHKVANTLNTKFDTASITKLFTSVSIFKLVDNGLIHLSDKALDIIDIGECEISKEVTIYQLLTHTSGIADDADEEAGELYSDLWIDKANYSIKTLEDFLPQFIHRKRNFEAGEGCRYNNCAYILLGMIIEKVSGQSYYDFVQTNVFDKANMKDTHFYSMSDIRDNTAEGYAVIRGDDNAISSWKKNIYSYPPRGASDAGAYTTVHDLDKFFRATFSGQFLSKELTKEIQRPKELYRSNEYRKKYMGYGFEFTTRNSDDKVFLIEKDGSNDGVACNMAYYPEIDTSVIILANNDVCDIWELAYELREFLDVKSK